MTFFIGFTVGFITMAVLMTAVGLWSVTRGDRNGRCGKKHRRLKCKIQA